MSATGAAPEVSRGPIGDALTDGLEPLMAAITAAHDQLTDPEVIEHVAGILRVGLGGTANAINAVLARTTTAATP